MNFPAEFRFPDVEYEQSKKITVGGVDFELYHAKGETDDATWYFTFILNKQGVCPFERNSMYW